MPESPGTEREKITVLILTYSDLFTEQNLNEYSDEQLSQIAQSLFIELRIKAKNKKKVKPCITKKQKNAFHKKRKRE